MTPAAQAAHDEGETVSGLALVVRELFTPLGLAVVSEVVEPESAEYDGMLVSVSGLDRLDPEGVRTSDAPEAIPHAQAQAQVRVRSGKITPTKVGLFVTHWRRTADGTTGPYGVHDSADTLLVTVAESGTDPAGGVFVFDRASLVAHGIVARDGRGGKRGFRVYPPWSTVAPGQASRTQEWQLEHFVPLPIAVSDLGRARRLLGARSAASGSGTPSETGA